MANVDSKWFGDEIAKELERATVEGLEAVAADFVRTAHPLTPILDQGFLRPQHQVGRSGTSRRWEYLH